MSKTTQYRVRDGFVVLQRIKTASGYIDRQIVAGETIDLNDAAYADHAHKLELADPKAAAAAAKAEAKAAAVKAMQSPSADLLAMMAQAFADQRAAAAAAVAAADQPAPQA